MFGMWRLKRRRKWYRVLLPALLALMLAVLLAGCGARESERLKSYGNDGYMGLSNANPNLPRTGSAWSYRNDGELVKQLLRPMRGVSGSRVRFDANLMQVTLFVDGALSREETARLTAKARSVLASNFPRYEVKVTSRQ
ncbi:hypothetical protein BG53_06740 [Paenibacillus darwinianus]|uniref:Sporulation protein n=1 Tax=Paenibacillus darwinianus TaxID=1380763 RepID=A0A9W5W6B3_9BACL|nr:hypothetical protein [Paenibacillus darwinianus]EXX85991.1 hypothetical protein CH50_08160 [Paenibacillus darwinianus]EXX86266.1 hypothetical protein BG53_06740 [Paenibacillus darwinianus]EXX86899.1 hypothetical protein BG52_05430 [Paenibacillus darwinianus]